MILAYLYSPMINQKKYFLHLNVPSNPQNSHCITMEKHIYFPSTSRSTASSPLAMHRNSQTISKTKPKIRIIHIFAPEIIQTDATNFRELVQRLTGKPTPADGGGGGKAKARKKEARVFSSSKIKKMESGFHAEFRERVKGEEEDIWRNANSGGGFLGGFAEFDGFMQEINHFPFLETQNQMLDAYGLSSQLV